MNSTEINLPAAETFPAHQVPWGVRDLILAVVVAALGLVALNLIVLGASTVLHFPLRQNPDALAIFLAVQDLIVVATAWLFSVVLYRVGWDRLGLRPYPVAMGCALSTGLLLLSYFIRLIYGLIAFALGLRLQQQDVLGRLDTTGIGFLLTLLVAAVIAPIAEEIFFRGFMYGGLRGRIGVIGATVVSTLFFTALHFSLELFIPIFVLGIFLVWLYEHTGSLYPGIFLHAANNGLSLILVFILQASGWMPPGSDLLVFFLR
ncbi:MAG: lysostaphin resistance A-like protein [Acidobacteriota bacterium]